MQCLAAIHDFPIIAAADHSTTIAGKIHGCTWVPKHPHAYKNKFRKVLKSSKWKRPVPMYYSRYIPYKFLFFFLEVHGNRFLPKQFYKSIILDHRWFPGGIDFF
jgi:hypothetical protein